MFEFWPKVKISNDDIDEYYITPVVDDKFEKSTEKIFRKSGCKPINKYSESPSLDDIKNSQNKVIRIGHMGESVKLIQLFLKKLNYDLGGCGVDGFFGPKTKKALEKFQEDNSINPISSAVDLKTLEGLISSTEKKQTNKTDSTKNKKQTKTEKSQSTTDDEYVIIKSDSYSGKDVHVLFGGAHTNISYSKNGANVSAMKKYISYNAIIHQFGISIY